MIYEERKKMQEKVYTAMGELDESQLDFLLILLFTLISRQDAL